eukprot:5019781-Pyramimonas_sp.AAC.1
MEGRHYIVGLVSAYVPMSWGCAMGCPYVVVPLPTRPYIVGVRPRVVPASWGRWVPVPTPWGRMRDSVLRY